jgi:hypothetical protein
MTITPATGQACATCGEAVLPGDLFCGHCGTPVAGDAGAATAFQPYPRRSTGRRVLAGVVAFVVVAGISGLIVAFVDARRDVDAQRDKAVAAQNSVVDLTSQLEAAQADLEATEDPDDAQQQQLVQAQADLVAVQAQLTQSQNDLAAEREGRAADAVAAQTQSSQAVAEVQGRLDAVQADLTALQDLFPIDENTFRGAAPAAEYAVTIQPLECTIVACTQVRSLSLSFPDPTKVSGNRANGVIAFDAGSYTSRGTISSEQSPQCNGVAAAATFELSFHASRVAFANGLLTMEQGVGTYRETIDAGDCAGQFRSYSVSMVKQ